MQSTTYYHQVISNSMSFSHNQPLYLSYAPTPRGGNKPQPLPAHQIW